jgi:hypothetical protein
MIRAMNLAVAIQTTAIDGKYVQRFSGGGRMAWQHMNVALLAHHMSPSGQKLGIVRTMGRMTIKAILADRWMVPEKRAAFFGVAGVTDIINGLLYKHLCPRAAVWIVARGATNLHVVKFGAKQVGRALKKRLAPVNVAAEASVFNCWR